MRRWCDLLIRAAAPLVPHDIRRDWMREWRAEFAFMAAIERWLLYVWRHDLVRVA